MNKAKPKTYPAVINGRRVRVTVPEDPAPGELLLDAVRENFSPGAVAAIVAHLQPAKTNNQKADREVAWLAERLVRLLGRPQYDALREELGL